MELIVLFHKVVYVALVKKELSKLVKQWTTHRASKSYRGKKKIFFIFFFFFFEKAVWYQKKGGCGHVRPSFSMTPTQDIRDLSQPVYIALMQEELFKLMKQWTAHSAWKSYRERGKRLFVHFISNQKAWMFFIILHLLVWHAMRNMCLSWNVC